MRHIRFKICAVLLLGLGLTGLQAQESVNASGGDATGSGGSVSFSIGQVAYQNHNLGGSVAEGIQQPYEIYIVTSVMEAEGIDLVVSAFPNPVDDHLILRVDRYNYEKLLFQLFDINGRIVKTGIITSQEILIDMTDVSRATYFLRVIDGDKEIKTFRIIKF
jgi:hypothetical protein